MGHSYSLMVDVVVMLSYGEISLHNYQCIL